MKNYLIFAVISMLMFGINSIIQKKAQNIDSISLSLFTIGTAFIIMLIVWLLNFKNKQISTEGIIYGGFAGLVFSTAYLLFIYSLRIGTLKIVILLNGLSAGVTILLSFFIFKESLNLYQIIGLCLGFAAIILFNLK
jgi:transporter family protein